MVVVRTRDGMPEDKKHTRLATIFADKVQQTQIAVNNFACEQEAVGFMICLAERFCSGDEDRESLEAKKQKQSRGSRAK